MLHPVILSGGAGSRLWPLSRIVRPKQLLPLISERSLLQETLLRLEGLAQSAHVPVAPPLVVANHQHCFLIAEQLREVNVTPQVLILEPVGRNTAPAIAVVALYLLSLSSAESRNDALMLVLPADQAIADVPAFHAAVAQAMDVARQGYFMTFGVTPRTPETGYGYIQRGAALSNLDNAYEVLGFVEKPNSETARSLIASGEHFWNSGMFLFGAARYLEELERFHPEITAACRATLRGPNSISTSFA